METVCVSWRCALDFDVFATPPAHFFISHGTVEVLCFIFFDAPMYHSNTMMS